MLLVVNGGLWEESVVYVNADVNVCPPEVQVDVPVVIPLPPPEVGWDVVPPGPDDGPAGEVPPPGPPGKSQPPTALQTLPWGQQPYPQQMVPLPQRLCCPCVGVSQHVWP